MTPVAIFRRAGSLLAPLCSALLLAACAATPSLPVADALPAAELRPVSRAGLKAKPPVRPARSLFQFDAGQDEDATQDDQAGLLEVPRVEKGDYSLGRGVMLGNASSAFREKGVASWYGKMFHGRKTSSGDPYDMYAMTAAHPSLPIPSYVRVTNLSNGRTAVVRINDRGPFHAGRIIDLSYAAAYKLGYVDQGQANVEVALVLPEEVAFVQPGRPVPPLRKLKAAPVQLANRSVPTPVPAAAVVSEAVRAPAAEPVVPSVAPLAAVSSSVQPTRVTTERPGGQVFLHLGAFATPLTAEQFKGFVEHELKWLKESVSVLASEGKYRLQLGPFPSAPEARSIAERIATTLKLKPYLIQR
ncbi:septal ring lytic transglycosylase RlpA family protein [Zoogloea oleivorans]|uniref:Endolytic peptidoglycan transglycosylase RlpA n=1 Tax=Zoogloea oleivorans TaxID=1552750 RepID=A0A6C2D541_9RHOO|nr:septal ring lytic transglycosylase RlpA family protein [Zoogloea oleivorans]TYC60769.1 septal ring lytic transglycosylase RlpA family protein [Zoogloea oleivorans]